MRGIYWLGMVAAVVVFADATLYLIVIAQEDTPNEWGLAASIATLIVLAGVLTVAGSLAAGSSRAVLLWPATVILVVLAVLGAMSIGPPLGLAGIVTAAGAMRATRARRPSQPRARPPRSASSLP